MRAATMVEANIPKLCAADSLNAWLLPALPGRVDRPARRLPAACAEGMSVQTQTPRLDKLRKGVMELYISDHPLDCLTCPANGDCELQDMAGAVGLRDVRYGGRGESPRPRQGRVNPYFTFDSKYIVCSRCAGLLGGAGHLRADDCWPASLAGITE